MQVINYWVYKHTTCGLHWMFIEEVVHNGSY